MLPDYRVLESHKDEQCYSLKIAISFPADTIFFDGHFDRFVLLPAVAQLVIAQTIAENTWGNLGKFTSLRQVKFRDPIYPDTMQQLQLEYCVMSSTLSFCYSSMDRHAENKDAVIIKSTGKILFQSTEALTDET